MFENIPDATTVGAKDQALAYWQDPKRFPEHTTHRTRIQKLTTPKTRAEKRRAKRFRGMLGAVAIMAMMPKPEITMYNGEM